MFDLRCKLSERMKNRRAAFLCLLLILFAFNASSAIGAKILFVVGKKPAVGHKELRTGDFAIKKHLEGRGLELVIKEDAGVKSEDSEGMDLVILSESARSRKIGTKFRDVAVPVICSEPWIFRDLGMTGRTKKADFGRQSRQRKLVIINPDHPLCASCSEKVQVCTKSFFMGWGVPGVHAIAVAGLSRDPHKCTIFAYDAGVEMPGLVAPAKRVGLFLFRNTPNSFTREGWALFDAAVDWSISGTQTASKPKMQTRTGEKSHHPAGSRSF